MGNSAAMERLSASLRIARLLQEKIERREFQPGEWLPTERELAREFSADRTTVRAAITHLAEGGFVMREAGRRPWIRVPAQTETGNGQNGNAQKEIAPRSSALQTIAAIIPQPPNYPALSSIQRGVLRTLRHAEPPYRLIVFDNQGEVWSQSVALERQALEAVENEGVAGAILWPIGGEETLPEIHRLQQKGIPLVLLDRCPDELSCDFVGVDNRAAVREAVMHLIQLGHRRIGHLTSDKGILTVREREEGYRETLRAHGLTVSEELIFRLPDQDDLHPDIRPAVDHFLALSEPPTAIFALKDLLAHALIGELKARGRRVPEDMSVIGFDDHDRHSPQPPFLTTVHQPFEDMGRRAAELLLRRLAKGGNVPPQHLLLPTPLVIRATCAAIPRPASLSPRPSERRQSTQVIYNQEV